METLLAVPGNVFVDTATGGKALYQRYSTTTGLALFRDDFEKAVPLIDNVYLVTGLEAARQYLRRLQAADLSPGYEPARLSGVGGSLGRNPRAVQSAMWFEAGKLWIGGRGTLTPRSGSSFDRLVTETRWGRS